ncbi:hypothetical protein ACE6H2_023417 [Prunus campanulata]
MCFFRRLTVVFSELIFKRAGMRVPLKISLKKFLTDKRKPSYHSFEKYVRNSGSEFGFFTYGMAASHTKKCK